jgi:two-component system cell cycle response regulator
MALILVIEDNPVNLELMVYLLQAQGHETAQAPDGETGLALARARPPELIVCDIQMPGLDGHGVAAAVRADPALRAIPLVAVTAAAMVGDRERALASGFDTHVAKPIEPQAFMALVQAFLLPPVQAARPPTAVGASLAGTPLPAELRAPRAGLVLLMVDDTPALLELKRDLLVPAGYSVLAARSAESAWTVLQQARVDLVLSDVVMPGSGGFALLRRLRADPVLQALPLLFLTSTARDETSRAEGLALGANAYLVRPIEATILLREVAEALRTAGRG